MTERGAVAEMLKIGEFSKISRVSIKTLRYYDAIGLLRELTRITGEDKFNILINNAGIGTSKTLEETMEESFDEVFVVNVKALLFLVQQALPLLRDEGRIVNVSSGVT